MPARRARLENPELTLEECEIILRALGSYQIQLFDKLSTDSSADSKKVSESIRAESGLVSSAIKKVHHLMEEMGEKQ